MVNRSSIQNSLAFWHHRGDHGLQGPFFGAELPGPHVEWGLYQQASVAALPPPEELTEAGRAEALLVDDEFIFSLGKVTVGFLGQGEFFLEIFVVIDEWWLILFNHIIHRIFHHQNLEI